MTEFVVGGTVPLESPSYVVRNFESACFRELAAGNWVLLLGPRQHGKSSGLVRLTRKLEDEGIQTAKVDFQSFSGGDTTYESTLRWLATRVAQAFRVSIVEPTEDQREDLAAWLEGSIPPGEGALAILVDEAGAVPVNAQNRFYSQLRALYNSKPDAPSDGIARRAVFLFAGTFRPERLINDDNSPFNVSRDVETDDLTVDGAEALAEQAGGPELRTWGARVFKIVGGQPYLLQLVLSRVSDGVDDAEREVLFDEAIAHLRSGRDRHFTALFEKIVADDSLRKIVGDVAARDDGVAFNGANADHIHLRVLGTCDDRAGRLVMRSALYREFALGNPQITLTDAARRSDQPLVHPNTAAFDVVHDEQLREIARESYEAGVDAHNAGHNRAALAAFGCALEAVLLDFLTALDAAALETARTSLADPPRHASRPGKWSFEKIIEVAHATPALAASNLHLADALRDWRNLIHPAVIMRAYRPDRDLRPEARMAPQVIEALLRDLAP